MKTKLTVILCTIVCFGSYNNATSQVDCSPYKNGTFYSYPKNSLLKHKIINQDDVQLSINMELNDTSVWKLKWRKHCVYELEYLSGGLKDFTPEQLALAKKYKLVFIIDTVTSEYYTYRATINNKRNVAVTADTLWFVPRSNVAGMSWATVPEDSISYYEKDHHAGSDYALAYVYRKGRILLLLAKYLMFIDDQAAAVLANRSAVVFRLFRPAEYRFKSETPMDVAHISVNVQPGKRYYLQSIINWGIQPDLGNHKLSWQLMDETKGREEFSKSLRVQK